METQLEGDPCRHGSDPVLAPVLRVVVGGDHLELDSTDSADERLELSDHLAALVREAVVPIRLVGCGAYHLRGLADGGFPDHRLHHVVPPLRRWLSVGKHSQHSRTMRQIQNICSITTPADQ